MDENKMIEYRVLLLDAGGQYEEKKSRFIAALHPCETEEEAAAFIEAKKKEYWDARHNVSAFVIGSRAELTRCSDDGEPSGTAGRPVLEILLGSGIRNAVVVVTRYFGGVLLGTGGLVRAYSEAVRCAVAEAQTGVRRLGAEIELEVGYTEIGRILYILGEKGIEPLSSDYGETIKLNVLIPSPDKDRFEKEITEATCGRALLRLVGEYEYTQKE